MLLGIGGLHLVVRLPNRKLFGIKNMKKTPIHEIPKPPRYANLTD